MASQSAHFNLTKPATTDYYDISVVNANTDIIDAQMYNNQVSAAKVMVGASTDEDGESGRVPAPSAGDEDKYLKADGTWDTPSGGVDMTGATSQSAGTHGLVPAPAAGDDIKFLKGDGTWDTPSGGGGNSWTDLTAVLEAGETSLTIIDSHITINGTYEFYMSKYGLNPLSVVIDDPTAIVLLQPLVTQESELIVTATASTSWSGFEPWKAFADSAVNSGWIASGGSGGYWLQAEFPYEVNISSVDFKSLDSNRSHAISRVSYSNDGDTFTDATLTSSTMQNNIGHADVSMSETAKYIRLCFDYSLDTQTYPMVSQLELHGYIDSSSAGSMTLTFEEQAEDINVKVRVS